MPTYRGSDLGCRSIGDGDTPRPQLTQVDALPPTPEDRPERRITIITTRLRPSATGLPLSVERGGAVLWALPVCEDGYSQTVTLSYMIRMRRLRPIDFAGICGVLGLPEGL